MTGTITDTGEGLYLFRNKPGSWILVEGNAICPGDKPPMERCSPMMMYFDITSKSDVYLEAGSSLSKVPAARLKKGQKVRADYTGYPVWASYPSQTDAREVVILRTN